MSDIESILSSFSNNRIAIIGDLMLDEYIWGNIQRISPEAPVPVVEIQKRSFVAGGAANTAANVVSLGGQALISGVIGEDQYGQQLHEALTQIGIESDGVTPTDRRPTTVKSRVIAQNQQVMRMDHESRTPINTSLENTLRKWVTDASKAIDAIIISDYGKGGVSSKLSEETIRLFRNMGKPIVVDPKGSDYAKYRGATVITPNVQEVAVAAGRDIHNDAELMEASKRLHTLVEGSALLVTRGADGMALFRSDTNSTHIPAVARNVFDVTGAGDTVVATLAMALATGASLEAAAEFANHAAGIVVEKFGTSTICRNELRNRVGH